MPKGFSRYLITLLLIPFWGWVCIYEANGQGFVISRTSGLFEPDFVIEGGLTWGIMNCVTDLQGNSGKYQGPFSGSTFLKSNFSPGLYFINTWRNSIGLRLEVNYGHVEAYDSLLKNATAPSAVGRYERNLNFRSPIKEVAVLGVFHIPQAFRSYDKTPYLISPYLMGGLSYFSFYPRAYTADGWVDLPPLRLEGQGFAEYPDRKVYSTNSFAYTFGFGFRYDASPKVTMRFEFHKRTTFTDYLDDVHEPNWVDPALFDKYLSPDKAALAKQLYNRSTVHNPPVNTRPRGNKKENDAFWTANFKIGIALNRSNIPALGGFDRTTKRYLRKKLRCPPTN